jgi:hypothetical protein
MGILVGHGAISPLQHGANFSEGGRWPHHGYEGRLLIKTLAETGAEDVDELAIGNRVPKFAELVGGGLDPLALDCERGVALNGVAELGVEAGDACVDVVLEELAERCPKISCRRSVAEHQIENLGGDPSVNPLDDGEVVLDPTSINWVWNGVGGDVAEEIAFGRGEH